LEQGAPQADTVPSPQALPLSSTPAKAAPPAASVPKTESRVAPAGNAATDAPAETKTKAGSSHEPEAAGRSRTLEYQFGNMAWVRDWSGATPQVTERSKAASALVMMPGTRLALNRSFEGDVEITLMGRVASYLDDGRFTVLMHMDREAGRGYAFNIAQRELEGRPKFGEGKTARWLPKPKIMTANIARLSGEIPQMLGHREFSARKLAGGFRIVLERRGGELRLRNEDGDVVTASDSCCHAGQVGLDCEGWTVELSQMLIRYSE
jgi:hypothetical protein